MLFLQFTNKPIKSQQYMVTEQKIFPSSQRIHPFVHLNFSTKFA